MQNKKRGYLVFIITVIIVIIVASIGVYFYNKKQENDTTSQTQIETAKQSKTINYQGQDGKTVYELLKEKYTVESEDSSFGVMVQSINGLKATDSEFWLYSVNGKSADVAADKLVTTNSDQVTWEYKGF